MKKYLFSSLLISGFVISLSGCGNTDEKQTSTYVYAEAKNIHSEHGKPDFGDKPPQDMNGNRPLMPPPGEYSGFHSEEVVGTAVYSIQGKTDTQKNKIIDAVKSNQSIIKVSNEGVLTISNSTLLKSKGDTTSNDSSNFNGLNAGVLAESSSKIQLSDTIVRTDSEGSNAIFATGENSIITLKNVVIEAKQNSSRGIDATYNGTVESHNTNITTRGKNSAAIATDRGEGTIRVEGGTATTFGSDSPGIYSTGNITVSQMEINAFDSEAAVIEGKNSITLNNVDITAYKKRGVMLYQSFSGDAGVGTSVFTMNEGKLYAKSGPIFFSTNTQTIINLNQAEILGDSGILLNVYADRWGHEGSNGADVTLNSKNEKLNGDILCDELSTIILNLESTYLKGSINALNSAKKITISLDEKSIWELKDNSYINDFNNKVDNFSNIKDNGNNIYYDKNSSANKWLKGKEYKLPNGGRLIPS